MKRFKLIKLLALLAIAFGGIAELKAQDPVKWEVKAECLGDKKVKLIATATIEDGWHVYDVVAIEESDPIKALSVPTPTRLYTDDAETFKDLGETTSPTKVHEEFDPVLDMNSRYWDKHCIIERTVELLKDVETIECYIEYQSCDDKQCIFPMPELIEVEVPAQCRTANSEKNTGINADGMSMSTTKPGDDNTEESDDPNADSDNPGKDKVIETTDEVHSVDGNNEQKQAETGEGPTSGVEEKEEEANSLWWLFLAGMGGGLVALLTPCVFPMIPMTVNFFVKQSGSRAKGISNALLYGAAIILIYTGLGFTLTKTLGPDIMNTLASDAIVNLIFFAVFVIFGISFLGAFEITLPSWIINKSDAQADKGGLIGIFFMAFTLAVVSFSCTGPIIGSQLVMAAQSGNNAGPLVTMFGFSLALAIPFMLFAIFPSWLANMPKSGGWLNSVKVVLGLVEIAFALKFFSTADLAYHWGILSREIFIALWVVIFAMVGFYLLGKLKFSHDSNLPYISVPRAMFAIIFLGFSVYLIPGLWGAPLKLMSGLAPPRHNVEDLKWMRRGMDGVAATTDADGFKKADHCPNGLSCTKDYYYALEYAKKQNKPIFVDFTGHSCTNCRLMEDNIWVDPKVDKLLRQYVIVSLYVDDRTELPLEEQGKVELNGKKFKMKTIGNKWTHFQITRYQSSSQPYYVLLGPDEKILSDPVGQVFDVEKYSEFLQKGL
ncbi:MAG: thioredoxin family protein, partial [Bacteroidetes bacterium]|nr:thioredoxin family protein [Bacteroidota bacterium]